MREINLKDAKLYGGSVTCKIRKLILELGDDVVIPVDEITEEFNCDREKIFKVTRQLDAKISITGESGEEVVCVCNPRTVKKYAKNKD